MAISLANGDGKEFSFMFRGSSYQGDFFGAEKLHDLNHNFAVSNVVAELIHRANGFLLWQFILRLGQMPEYRFLVLTIPENYYILGSKG